jgi:hypothetical protein
MLGSPVQVRPCPLVQTHSRNADRVRGCFSRWLADFFPCGTRQLPSTPARSLVRLWCSFRCAPRGLLNRPHPILFRDGQRHAERCPTPVQKNASSRSHRTGRSSTPCSRERRRTGNFPRCWQGSLELISIDVSSVQVKGQQRGGARRRRIPTQQARARSCRRTASKPATSPATSRHAQCCQLVQATSASRRRREVFGMSFKQDHPTQPAT